MLASVVTHVDVVAIHSTERQKCSNSTVTANIKGSLISMKISLVSSLQFVLKLLQESLLWTNLGAATVNLQE